MPVICVVSSSQQWHDPTWVCSCSLSTTVKEMECIDSIDTTWKAGCNLEGVVTKWLRGLLGVVED